jgi:hypothetical protein
MDPQNLDQNYRQVQPSWLAEACGCIADLTSGIPPSGYPRISDLKKKIEFSHGPHDQKNTCTKFELELLAGSTVVAPAPKSRIRYCIITLPVFFFFFGLPPQTFWAAASAAATRTMY